MQLKTWGFTLSDIATELIGMNQNSDLVGLDSFGLELDWSDQASDWIEACNGLDLRLPELLELRRLYPFRKQVSCFR